MNIDNNINNMQTIIKNIAKIAFVAAIMLPFNGANAATPISCPLTAGSNSYIVNFPSTVIVSNTGTAFANEVSTNTNLPAGNYDITAVTWDDHSGHGGQNQPKEQLYFQFYNSSGTSISMTGNTNDIAENLDTATTVLGNSSIASSIARITARHTWQGRDTRYQSVYPICIKMSRTDTPPPPTPEPTDFSVSCSVSDRNVDEDDDVTFTANVSGGTTPFTYRWSGDISGSGRSITESFNDEGDYHVNVRVTDDVGRIRSADCATVVVGEENNNDLEVSCEVSDSSVEEGDDVKIEVEIDGGNSPYDISWDGDTDEVDDFDEDARSQRIEFEDSGRYEFEVTVEDDDGNEESDTCIVRVSDEDDDRTIATTDGDLAGLSSVYLSQVPYTGPEDAAKVFGFIALIAVWSSMIAYYLLKNRTRSIVKSKIDAFKAANLAKKQVRG